MSFQAAFFPAPSNFAVKFLMRLFLPFFSSSTRRRRRRRRSSGVGRGPDVLQAPAAVAKMNSTCLLARSCPATAPVAHGGTRQPPALTQRMSKRAAPPQRAIIDVVIVGGGPVGAFCALLLRSLGMRCLVIEREQQACGYPRAVALDGDAARLVGLASPHLCAWLQQHVLPCSIDIRNGSPCGKPPSPLPPTPPHPLPRQQPTPAAPHCLYSRAAADAASCTILGPIHPETHAASAFPRVSFFHQPTFESALFSMFDAAATQPTAASDAGLDCVRAAAEACSSSPGPCALLVRGAEVHSVRVSDDGVVSVSVTPPSPSSAATSLSCRFAPPPHPHLFQPATTILSRAAPLLPFISRRRFLLAADGASSSVRKQLRTAYAGTSAASQWYIVDAVCVSPQAEAALLHHWSNFNFCCGCDTVFVHARTPSSPAHHRWEFLLPSHSPLAPPPSSSHLLRRIGVDPTLVRVIREVRRACTCTCASPPPSLSNPLQVQYSFHSRVAAQWMFQHRIALVGDAAHCMPPFRAQGLASGLHDASNICWKIASVLLGQSHPHLLDTYQSERLHHVRAAIAAAEGMGSMICLRRPKLLWHLKNRAFALLNAAGLFDLLFRHFTPSVSISCGLIGCARTPSAAAAAVGAPVPNLRISRSNAAQRCFDEVFWDARGGRLRWCILTAKESCEEEATEVSGDGGPGSHPEAFVVVRCDRSSDMGMWLGRCRCTAAVVRCSPPPPRSFALVFRASLFAPLLCAFIFACGPRLLRSPDLVVFGMYESSAAAYDSAALLAQTLPQGVRSSRRRGSCGLLLSVVMPLLLALGCVLWLLVNGRERGDEL
jgi:hypothetical protein